MSLSIMLPVVLILLQQHVGTRFVIGHIERAEDGHLLFGGMR